MDWHILGAGSLGCLWAARLAAQKNTVQLILRDSAAITRYQQTPGIGLTDAQQHSRYYPIPAQLASDSQPIQCLLLACKAYDAQAAISQVAARLSGNSIVILLQNGLGSQQAIQQMLPEVRCIAASSTEGAYQQQPFHSVFAGAGHTFLGDLQPQLHSPPDQFIAQCSAAQINLSWSADINEYLWRKLAINCAINPMTAVHNCRNGELTQHAEQVNRLCAQLQLLLERAGQSAAAQNLTQQVWAVIEKTAANSSSMRQDLLNQRRSEISYITGFACAQSNALECSTPTLHALHAQLQQTLLAAGLPAH